MMAELRVPPAVTFKFERFVAEVCHGAKLDDHEWPLKARELLSHLQERWREGVETGLSDAAAEQRALDLFGSSRAVARQLRRPWWRRLLFHQNRRQHRLLTFLTASLIGTLLLGMSNLLLAKESLPDVGQIIGSFTNSFIALVSLLVVKWQPIGPTWLKGVLSVRHLLWPFIGLGLANVAFNPVAALVLLLRLDWGILTLPVLAVAIPFGWLGAACLGSEILNLADRCRRLTPETMAFQMIR